jgi:thioesterase domain-containing protein
VDRFELQHYLHEHIPLSTSMEIGVVGADHHGVTLSAPLAPNINHRDTVFGGSASAVAILAGWALLHIRLNQDSLSYRIVIQRNTMNYERPIRGAFVAVSTIQDSLAWEIFMRTLKRKQRARVSVTVNLFCQEEKVGELEGDFAAFRL